MIFYDHAARHRRWKDESENKFIWITILSFKTGANQQRPSPGLCKNE